MKISYEEATSVVVIVVALILTAGVTGAFMFGSAKTEKAECIKWSNDAHLYPAYYITGWQKDQCDARGIGINAPVVRQ